MDPSLYLLNTRLRTNSNETRLVTLRTRTYIGCGCQLGGRDPYPGDRGGGCGVAVVDTVVAVVDDDGGLDVLTRLHHGTRGFLCNNKFILRESGVKKYTVYSQQ